MKSLISVDLMNDQSYLQNDLGWSFIGLDKSTDKYISTMFRCHILTLETIPGKFDQFSSMVKQLIGDKPAVKQAP